MQSFNITLDANVIWQLAILLVLTDSQTLIGYVKEIFFNANLYIKYRVKILNNS